MNKLFWTWIISAAALFLASLVLTGVHLVKQPWYTVLWVAALLGLLNVVVGLIVNIVSVLACPITLLTLGCFSFLLSFALYTLGVYWLSSYPAVHPYFSVDSLTWAAALAVVMALFSSLLNVVLPGKQWRK